VSGCKVSAAAYLWPGEVPTTDPSHRRKPRTCSAFVPAWGRLRRELAACGARTATVHMGVTVDRDGFPPPGFDFKSAEPGVVVYLSGRTGDRVLSCDAFTSLPANIAALAVYLKLLRQSSRCRVHDTMEIRNVGVGVAS